MSRNRSHKPFVIRPARVMDTASIIAFCERTYEWGDYVPDVLDEWLADGRGQLLVATVDDVPVGVAYVVLLTPTEAWLQGLRVHPEHQRRGLAHQFLRRCLDAAHQRGARVARLATSSKNVAVHRTVERVGMRRVATMWVLEASATSSTESAEIDGPDLRHRLAAPCLAHIIQNHAAGHARRGARYHLCLLQCSCSAGLPPQIAEAARARGRAIDSWQTADQVLNRLSAS